MRGVAAAGARTVAAVPPPRVMAAAAYIQADQEAAVAERCRTRAAGLHIPAVAAPVAAEKWTSYCLLSVRCARGWLVSNFLRYYSCSRRGQHCPPLLPSRHYWVIATLPCRECGLDLDAEIPWVHIRNSTNTWYYYNYYVLCFGQKWRSRICEGTRNVHPYGEYIKAARTA